MLCYSHIYPTKPGPLLKNTGNISDMYKLETAQYTLLSKANKY